MSESNTTSGIRTLTAAELFYAEVIFGSEAITKEIMRRGAYVRWLSERPGHDKESAMVEFYLSNKIPPVEWEPEESNPPTAWLTGYTDE
jgi:hypothetical protein